MEKGRNKQHIVMFPLMAQSHIIPFLTLALQFEQKEKANISFVTTPLYLPYIQSCLPSSSSIRLLTIPFNASDHGLPPVTEKTDHLPPHMLHSFIMATASLKPAFTQLITTLIHDQATDNNNNIVDPPPLCIISDMFFGWVSHVARQLGAFHVIFCGAGGFGMACYYSISINGHPHMIKSNSDDFSLPDFQEAGKLHLSQVPPSLLLPPDSLWVTFMKKRLDEWTQCHGFLFNSVEELDGLGLAYFRRVTRRPVWPIGPIISVTPAADEEFCMKWLDSKPEKSVLYVSFGSLFKISETQMVELAKALQVSDKNFIWVMRKPLEFGMEKSLPKEFMQHLELGKRGLLIEKWAPQVAILSHKSTSAFMSHCGWNSVLEALVNGVPIIGWPLQAEQHLNAKYLEESVGVCVEVGRGYKTKSDVRYEKIVEKIEIVMGERDQKGRNMRERASQVKEMIRSASRDEDGFKGSSVKAMDEFLNAASTRLKNEIINV